jgi:hypothetical protein
MGEGESFLPRFRLIPDLNVVAHGMGSGESFLLNSDANLGQGSLRPFSKKDEIF